MDGNTYPTGADGKTRDYSNYSKWMADFIRDVRKDLSAPKMPFVIGVLGVGGLKANDGTIAFRKAMAAPAALQNSRQRRRRRDGNHFGRTRARRD